MSWTQSWRACSIIWVCHSSSSNDGRQKKISMRGGSLWKLSLRISPQVEDAVTELLESVFGQPASVYADAISGATSASVYLSKAEDCSAAKRAMLRNGLQRIRQCGLG